jgi:hypothetical protein
LVVSVVEGQGSLTTVEVVIEVVEGWLEDHYQRLDAITKLQGM